MPLTPPTVAAPIASNLASTGHVGAMIPSLAMGVANGILLWFQYMRVTTYDTGQLGVGTGLTPLVVPPTTLQAAFFGTFAAQGILGVWAPRTIVGLANGISTGIAPGLVTTQHPLIGVGAGVCRFTAPPATPSLVEGFGSAGFTGSGAARLAAAIGTGLDAVFYALVLPTPIAGAGSPASGGGTGFGQIV
jgi:hypothetical protein